MNRPVAVPRDVTPTIPIWEPTDGVASKRTIAEIDG